MRRPSQFVRLARSRDFRTRAEAEKWAAEQKETYSRQDLSTKTEINFLEKTSRWDAKIFIRASGKRGVNE